MLLTDQGLDLRAFDPVLADVLGCKKGEEGCNILSQAVLNNHPVIGLRDVLYCLVSTPGTELRKFLVDDLGKAPEKFICLLEQSLDEEEGGTGAPLLKLTRENATPGVHILFNEEAEKVCKRPGHDRIDDSVLSYALLKGLDSSFRDLLSVWSGEKRYADFVERLRKRVEKGKQIDIPSIWKEDGGLDTAPQGPFTRRALGFLDRLREDVASTNGKKLTNRHLLYALLSGESTPLSVGLSIQGLDVKKDMHATLSREITQPGHRRNDAFVISQSTIFKSVEIVLDESRMLAGRRGANRISEVDIHLAFVTKQAAELTRLVPQDSVIDMVRLLDFLKGMEPEEEENAQGPTQVSIREIAERINGKIFGQRHAVGRIMPWIKRLRFGLPRDGRPAGVFLFLGPTGTGKTQMAKELARHVFGDEEMIIFLEMGQYKSKESMNNFVGAPAGYVGYGEGKLTNGLRDHPQCVVLFDEIEKANTEVFDALLRFCDEGMISDPAGPVRDGTKCIIVLTTNAGQRWLRSHLKNHPVETNDPETLAEQLFDEAMKELQETGFRPEFLGRVDERNTFLPFTPEVCRQIVDGVLAKEIDKLKTLKGVTLEVDDEVRGILADFAFKRSIDEGARGAPRAVNEFVVTPLIDILSTSQENGEGLPSRIVAIRDCTPGAGKKAIKLEVCS